MLRTRLVTAAIALPAILAAILFLPNWAFSLLIGLFGLWGLYEVYEVTPTSSLAAVIGVLILFGLVPLQEGLWGLPTWHIDFTFMVATVIAMCGQIVLVGWFGAENFRAILDRQRGDLREAAVSVVGFASVGFLFPYFALVRNGSNGIALIILMLLLVVCADSGAYFVGRAIGRHKLAFKVSPGKTIEGAIGGILASIAGGLILRGWLIPDWSIGGTVLFSAIVAVLAIIGDLANSAFKRIAGVKDSGWIFPGHGGLLDRTCSLVLAAVFTYYYSR